MKISMLNQVITDHLMKHLTYNDFNTLSMVVEAKEW